MSACHSLRATDPHTFETEEVFWHIAPLYAMSKMAKNIAEHIIAGVDDLGSTFWHRVMAFGSDACNTMGMPQRCVTADQSAQSTFLLLAEDEGRGLDLSQPQTAEEEKTRSQTLLPS